MQTRVFCTTKFEGVHCYPSAPEEVRYLAWEHRHIFGVRVEMDVFDDDREVEFIMLKHKVEHAIKCLAPDGKLGSLSCEQIAKAIVGYLIDMYCANTQRHIIVTVDEDGENGAIVNAGTCRRRLEHEWDDVD